MNTRIHTAASILFALAMSSSALPARAQDDDAVIGAFERLLNHEPMQTVARARPDIGADPLVQAMLVPLRDGQAAGPTQARNDTSRPQPTSTAQVGNIVRPAERPDE